MKKKKNAHLHLKIIRVSFANPGVLFTEWKGGNVDTTNVSAKALYVANYKSLPPAKSFFISLPLPPPLIILQSCFKLRGFFPPSLSKKNLGSSTGTVTRSTTGQCFPAQSILSSRQYIYLKHPLHAHTFYKEIMSNKHRITHKIKILASTQRDKEYKTYEEFLWENGAVSAQILQLCLLLLDIYRILAI